MTCFGRALTGVVAAASLLIGATAVGKAAGALAIGACGAYGFAYDYAEEDAAAQAALGKCTGSCKVVPVRRACGAIAIDVRNACGAGSVQKFSHIQFRLSGARHWLKR
jgi:Domain of unknown function (DUF4189)